jgi:methyl-accepting chemotaxis protein WspA
MKRLKLWQKFALVGCILMLPSAVITFLMVRSINTLGSEFARQELRGLEYSGPLRTLVKDLARHRGVMATWLGGDASFKPQVDEARRDIETDLKEVGTIDQRLDPSLHLTAAWAESSRGVRELLDRSSSLSASESFALHTKVIDDLIAHITRVGDASNLTLDPDLDSYYLMAVVIFQGPELAETIAKARGLGGRLAASKSASADDLAELNRLGVLIDFLQNKVADSRSKVTRANPTLKAQMSADSREVKRAVDDASREVGRIMASHGRDVDPAAYFSTLTRSVDIVGEVDARSAEALTTLLHARVDKFNRQITVALVCAILGLIGVFLIGYLWMRDVSRTLEKVVRAANLVAVGEVDVERLSQGRKDETGLLARSLEQIALSSKEMAQIAGRIADGDLTVAFTPRSDRDVLGQALANMVERLSALLADVQRSGQQVGESASEISATARQQQATASEIAATTTEIGATSREISATSRELVKTMSEVSAVAEQSAALAGSGQDGLTRMEETMRQVMDAAGSINAKLAVLNEKAGNINQVVTTITKVADQTNLLSLNAAIEAEKAGEYGRGFAVVATEIRRLADQTAVATYDIERMVKEIQSAVTAGVMGMDKFSEEVRRGMQDVQQVSGHLSQIIQQVQALAPRCEAVSEGMQAQATGAEQITEALTQLSEAAQQTVQSLRQSNQVIEGLNRATGDIRAGASRFNLAA